MNNKYYNIMQLSFNWVHPSCMYWPTQSSLMWKMNRKCTMISKKAGGNIISSLQRVMIIFSSNMSI